AEIAVEDIVSEVRDEQIGEAVVVEIAGAHTLAPARLVETGVAGHVAEGSISLIMIQMAAWSLAIETSAVDEENVRITVVVKIENSCAVAGHFENIFLGALAAIDVRRGEARGGGDIPELDLRDGQIHACFRRSTRHCFVAAAHALGHQQWDQLPPDK